MARPVRIGLIILAALVVLLLLTLLFLQSAWARGLLEEQISQRLDGREVEIGHHEIDWGLPLGIRLENVRLGNAEWADEDDMFRADGIRLGLGFAGLQRLEMQRPQVHLQRQADGTSNWDALTPEDPDVPESEAALPELIRIDDGRLSYRDEALDARVEMEFSTEDDGEGGRRLQADGRGELQGRPLQFIASGGPPGEALADDAPYRIDLSGNLGQIELAFSGRAEDLPNPDQLQGQLRLSAPQAAELAAPLADSPLDVPAFDLQAQVRQEGERLMLEDIDLQSGDSRLTGSLAFEPGDAPRFDAHLRADQLDLNRWGVIALLEGRDETEPEADGLRATPQQRLADLLEPLRRYRGQVDVEIGELHYGEASLQDLAMKGELGEGRLQIDELRLRQGQGGVEVEGALAFEPGPVTGELDAQIDRLNLGEALAPLGYPDLGVLNGELHAEIGEDAVTLRDSRLAWNAPAYDLRLQASIDTGEDGTRLQGSGSRHDIPFRFNLTTGPLLALFGSEQPWPVQGRLAAADTTAQINGSLTRPLELGAAEGEFSIEGPDPARLNPLLGADLPSLPGYSIEGGLDWDDPLLRIQKFNARLGESDLSGDIRLRLEERPMLWATLHSQRLDVDELMPPEEDEQEREGPLFSDEPLPLEPLRGFDARIVYSADNLNAREMPLQQVELELELERGALTVAPLHVGLGGGDADGRLSFDAGQTPAELRVDLSVSGVRLTPLLRPVEVLDLADTSAAVIGGEVQLHGRGDSLAALMAGLNGQMEMAMSRGELDKLLMELLGLDVTEALIGYLAEQATVTLQCAYARVSVDDGLAELAQLFIASDDSNIIGEGSVNLAAEELDLTVQAHPKDFSLPASSSPIHLQGELSDPQVNPVSAGLVARGAASVVGALVAPPLAILPWIEPGLGEGAGIGCRQALESFEGEIHDS